MRVRTAIGWTTAGTGIAQACSLIRLLVVAAVVSTQDMGIYAMAASLTAAAGMLGDSGLRQLYLSRQTDEMGFEPQSFLSTVWMGILGARMIIAALTIPLALIATNFVDLPGTPLLWMTLALAGCAVLAALRNPAQLFHERAGNFAPSVKAESHGQILGLAVVLAAAHFWPSIWLLLIGQAASAAASTAASYLIDKPMHTGTSSLPMLLRLARKGRPFLVISTATYVTASLDKLLLGAMLSPAAAGVYFLAQRLSDAPRALYASVFGRTALPYYAWQRQHNGVEAVRRAAGRYLSVTAAIFSGGVILVLLARLAVPEHLLKHQWAGVLALIPIMLAGTGMRAACHAISPSFVVAGRMDIEARLKIQEAVAYLILLPISIHIGGVEGAAWIFLIIYGASMYRRYAKMRALYQGSALAS